MIRRGIAVSGWLGLLASTAWALEVSILSPAPDRPVFGKVVFEVQVVPLSEVRAVTLMTDGRLLGELTTPPFRLEVDVGEANQPHLFEAIATDVEGRTQRRRLEAPALPIDLTIDVELQQLYLTVTRAGHPVLDLDRREFHIEDNGARQEIVTFERGDIPFVAVLLVDSSHSMAGAELDAALGGARAFAAAMQSLDQAKLILFNDRVALSTPFTSFPEILTAGLSSVRAQGGTSLNDHLYLALKLLEQRQGRRLVILLSDGIDITSALRMSDVMEVARRSQSLVYWIRLGELDSRASHFSSWRDGEGHRRELHELQALVDQSGGRILIAASAAETEPAFLEILEEIRNQYVIGYYPTVNRGDGRWHKLRVRVRGTDLSVRGRTGYLDY